MSIKNNVLSQAEQLLVLLAKIESIKDETSKNPKDLQNLITEAQNSIELYRINLAKIQYRIQPKEYNHFKSKLDELAEYFKKFNIKKLKYEEQPLIDSFNMDEFISQQSTSGFRPFQDSQNANSLMSQSILSLNKKEKRSKSLKPMKDPVCFVKSKKPRTSSLEPSQAPNRKSLEPQFMIPDSQTNLTQDNLENLIKKPSKLTIRLIQDEELIPLSDCYWENLSNGKIDLKKEFEKDFVF